MTLEEAREFFREIVFVHLPNVYGWLNQNSPKPDKTLDGWCRILADIEFAEANRVAYRWIKGELPSPQGFEIQDVALHLKAVVMQDRYNARKHLVVQEIRDKPTSSKQPVLLAPYYARILANGQQYKDGVISLDECKARNNAIIKEHDEAGRV